MGHKSLWRKKLTVPTASCYKLVQGFVLATVQPQVNYDGIKSLHYINYEIRNVIYAYGSADRQRGTCSD